MKGGRAEFCLLRLNKQGEDIWIPFFHSNRRLRFFWIRRRWQPEKDAGRWSVRVDRSSWVALLVRGHYQNKPEIIVAHTSPVMIQVDGSAFFSALDAVTILDQIEGALAYLDTVGTRAEDAIYKRLRLKLTSAHRKLHNELHQRGHFHEHVVAMPHE